MVILAVVGLGFDGGGEELPEEPEELDEPPELLFEDDSVLFVEGAPEFDDVLEEPGVDTVKGLDVVAFGVLLVVFGFGVTLDVLVITVGLGGFFVE